MTTGSKLISKQTNWESFSLLREGRATRPLRLTAIDDPVTTEQAWGLFTGSLTLGRSLVLKAYRGGLATDVLWTSFIPIMVISQRLVELFTTNGFTGWSTYPAEVYGRKGECIPGYQGLAITGPSVDRDVSRSVIEARVSPRNPRYSKQVYKGFYFNESQWDGSDFFRNIGFMFITKRVRDALVQNKIINISLVPLPEVDHDVPGTGKLT